MLTGMANHREILSKSLLEFKGGFLIFHFLGGTEPV